MKCVCRRNVCCRKAHLKETQGRIMDLNDKIAVVTQTLQQALSGLQSKIEEDTRKVKPVSLSPEIPEWSIFPTIPCSMQLPERLHVFVLCDACTSHAAEVRRARLRLGHALRPHREDRQGVAVASNPRADVTSCACATSSYVYCMLLLAVSSSLQWTKYCIRMKP